MKYLVTVDRTPGRESVIGNAVEYDLPLDEDKLRGILIDALLILADQRAKAVADG